MAKKILSEASIDDQRALSSVKYNKADVVEVRGKRFKVRWMHPSTGDWISELMIREGGDRKIIAQSAALIVLNGFWRAHLLYWLVWRWFYYIKQYTTKELTPLIEMAQKKTAQEEAPAYLNATILLTALSTLRKQMTKEEAEHTLHALRSDKDGSSPKSTASVPSH